MIDRQSLGSPSHESFLFFILGLSARKRQLERIFRPETSSVADEQSRLREPTAAPPAEVAYVLLGLEALVQRTEAALAELAGDPAETSDSLARETAPSGLFR
jgi:hypothetical protein